MSMLISIPDFGICSYEHAHEYNQFWHISGTHVMHIRYPCYAIAEGPQVFQCKLLSVSLVYVSSCGNTGSAKMILTGHLGRTV